jgi:hypothetical protein
MRAFVEAGYDGPIGPDHAVRLVGDNARGDRYWAYAIGYLRALLQVLQPWEFLGVRSDDLSRS